MLQLDELIRAYTNEKSTQQLLMYDSVVDLYVNRLEGNILSNDYPANIKMLHEIEAERIKYFVKEYLLVRLDKIRKNIFVSKENLSSNESIFYDKYISLLESYDILGKKAVGSCEYVGFVCVRSLENVKIDGEITEIREGDFFVANFNDVMEYVANDYIRLV